MRVTRDVPYSQRGAASPLATLLVLLIITAVIYAGVQIGMLQLAYMNVKEKTAAEMMYVMVPPFENVEVKVRDKIVGLLEEIDARYNEEHIKINVSENGRYMQVEIWYSKSHNLPFYPNPKEFYIALEHRAPSA